jgi:hypothetical protein
LNFEQIIQVIQAFLNVHQPKQYQKTITPTVPGEELRHFGSTPHETVNKTPRIA